jgi:hypothetical protein
MNPFLYSSEPYVQNPFTILEVPPDASQATIELFARAPGPGRAAGEFARAAQWLQNPTLRLAFDLMLHCEAIPDEE